MWRLARYLLAYLGVLGAAAAMAPLREIDWKVLGLLNRGEAPPWQEKAIALVDLPERKGDSREAFRGDVAALLKSLVADPVSRPKAIVLDIAFTSEPRGLGVLKDGLAATRKAEVPVYAAVDPYGFGKDKTPDYLDSHAKELYLQQIDGMGHTLFDVAGSTLRYQPVLALGASDSQPTVGVAVDALVFKVAQDQTDGMVWRGGEWLVMNVGDRDEYLGHIVRFDASAAPGREFHRFVRGAAGEPVERPRFAGKTVIVGSFETDIARAYNHRPGPELVAWALNERMAPSSYVRPNIVTHPAVLLAMILACSAAAAGVFYVLFRVLPKQRSRLWLLGSISAVVALALLAAAVAAMRGLGDLYAQVTLPVIGIAMATSLAWRGWRRRLAEDAFSADLERRRSAAASEYDVFISYSREPENKEWVTRNVYEPLMKARKADGSGLRVFFDTESIPVGVTWYETLAEAINNSRFFLPVYSEDYFRKDFCKFEIQQAAIKRAGQADFVVPVARVMKGIPPGYHQINAFDIALHPDFIDKILRVVLTALAAAPAE